MLLSGTQWTTQATSADAFVVTTAMLKVTFSNVLTRGEVHYPSSIFVCLGLLSFA